MDKWGIWSKQTYLYIITRHVKLLPVIFVHFLFCGQYFSVFKQIQILFELMTFHMDIYFLLPTITDLSKYSNNLT